MESPFPSWWPDHPPLYDITKTYAENFSEGPFFSGSIPARTPSPEREWGSFLGFRLASPLGVPAGPLLNGRWVRFAAQMGFDLVTYKTIRSAPHPAHPLPNMVYVSAEELSQRPSVQVVSTPPQRLSTLAVTNSFGIPSQGRDFLVQDIAETRAALGPGQLLLVSFVGTPRPGEELADDFVRAAEIALEGGAPLLEADLSCPNVKSGEGELFLHPDLVFTITARLRQKMGSVPLVLKIGHVEEESLLTRLLYAAARGGAQALCAINTVRKEVVDEKGRAALGEGRRHAGVCGGAIHQAAVECIRKMHAINEREKLGLTLLGTGGVMEPDDFSHFLDAGAAVAMSAAGWLWDPYLAMRYQWKKRQTAGG